MSNGSSLDRLEAETFTNFHGNSSCLVGDRVNSTEIDKTKQKSLFCQFFPVYLKENCSRGNARPVPVMLGDGQLLDLYHLFSLVKKHGGHDGVSRKGLWDSVIVELGLDLHVLALVKLVYEKYLSGFEGWLSNAFNGDAASCVELSTEAFHSRKHEGESSSEMVTWTSHIAKHLFDPAVKLLPEPSKWKERDIHLVREHAEPNRGSYSQKVKMHPAMHEDPVALNHQGTKKLRYSKRLRSPGNRNKFLLDKNTAKPGVAGKKKFMSSLGGFHETCVPIGSHFQVKVPEWTGVASKSDPKWLGTQVWPVKDDSKPTTETDLVGRGRRGKCSCNVQGSVDCVRFHIAGNRMKLKHELGSLFYQWGFDRMGEGVSLQWTAEEEKKFKDSMRLNISAENKAFWIDFWNNTSADFLMKTREDLVNYYFNVYLIQQRSYQNRVTPKTVDSDDDEVEFGSFGDGFGRKAIKHRYMEFIECSKNTQCFDFE
ncbi:unnamed protein product [Lathyrus sativus]|nr:unnamed protein product [Lathyrus sativus]